MTRALLVCKLDRDPPYFEVHKLESACPGSDAHLGLIRALAGCGDISWCFSCFPSVNGSWDVLVSNPVRVWSPRGHWWRRHDDLWFRCQHCGKRNKLKPGRPNLGLSLEDCDARA